MFISSNLTQIHLLDYDDETNKVSCKSLFDHSAEVWRISPSLKDPDLIWTTFPKSGCGLPDSTTLWRLRPESRLEEKSIDRKLKTDEDIAKVLGIKNEQEVAKDLGDVPDEEVVELESVPNGKPTAHKNLTKVVGLGISPNSLISKTVWNPENPNLVVTVQEDTLRLWDISRARSGDMRLDESIVIATGDGRSTFCSGAFDPIHPNQFVVAEGTGVSVWDSRKKQ